MYTFYYNPEKYLEVLGKSNTMAKVVSVMMIFVIVITHMVANVFIVAVATTATTATASSATVLAAKTTFSFTGQLLSTYSRLCLVPSSESGNCCSSISVHKIIEYVVYYRMPFLSPNQQCQSTV